MPIAAKFSEAFYQKFGHEATGELVEYLNAIDATYRAESDRRNDLNWSRVESRIAQTEERVDKKLAELESRLRMEFLERFAVADVRWEQRVGDLRAEMLKEIGRTRIELLAGTGAAWVTIAVAVLGLYFKG